jgi:hypothetical protein
MGTQEIYDRAETTFLVVIEPPYSLMCVILLFGAGTTLFLVATLSIAINIIGTYFHCLFFRIFA